ncbi:10697_t:CDS:2, partial [Gigaspora margarita]
PDDQCNCDATITGCKWYCNFSIGNIATEIRCSLINDNSVHNHPMDSNIKIEPVIGHVNNELRALVIVVDNNTRSRLVAQILLPNESIDSFNWLFICLKKGNSAYEPNIIFFDSDYTIAAVISTIFPLAHYHLCIFYIEDHCANEPDFTNTCIEDDYNSQQIHLNSLLNNILYDSIKEVWHIVRLT